MTAQTLLVLLLALCATLFAQDCLLVVPANPLSAAGLATPYILKGLNPSSNCSMSNPDQQTFVEGVIFNPFTGQLAVYNPVRVKTLLIAICFY